MSRKTFSFLKFTGALRWVTTFSGLWVGYRKGLQIIQVLGDQLRSFNAMVRSYGRSWDILSFIFHLSPIINYKTKLILFHVLVACLKVFQELLSTGIGTLKCNWLNLCNLCKRKKKKKKKLGHHPYNTDEHLPLWEGKFQTESYFSGKRSLLLINLSG